MGHYTKLAIFKDCYELTKDVLTKVNKIDKRYRYTLGDDIRRTLFAMLHLINEVNTSDSKIPVLNKFLLYYERLKLDLQLCIDMHIFSPKILSTSFPLLKSVGEQAENR